MLEDFTLLSEHCLCICNFLPFLSQWQFFLFLLNQNYFLTYWIEDTIVRLQYIDRMNLCRKAMLKRLYIVICVISYL